MIQRPRVDADQMDKTSIVCLSSTAQSVSSMEDNQRRYGGLLHPERLHQQQQTVTRRQQLFQSGSSNRWATILLFLTIMVPGLSFSPVSVSSHKSSLVQRRAPNRTTDPLLLKPKFDTFLSTQLFFQQSNENSDDESSIRMATSSDSTVNGSIRNDLIRTGFWVAAAVAFGVFLGVNQGTTTAEEFFAGYLIEQSLSVDNLFVFLLLFESFGVTGAAQQKVLTYGIAGAVVMRAGMIGLGAAALQRFRGILLIFAGILLYSSFNLLTKAEDDEEDEGTNAIIKFSQSVLDTTDDYDGDNFFSTVEVGKATPLLVCMIAVELSDIVFAVDSIPAVFGVTEVCTLSFMLSTLTNDGA